MQYITTTELRTKSSKLVETLRGGQGVTLIHRSKVIGRFEPSYDPPPFDAEKREKIYRSHLIKK